MSKTERWSAGWAATLLVSAALLSPAAAQTKTPNIKFERYTLPNGFEVILHQDKTVPLVAVDVWYHVAAGART